MASPAPPPPSVRFLQLKDVFHRAVTLGIDCLDKEAFVAVLRGAGVVEELLEPLWPVYVSFANQVIGAADAEFGLLCREMDVEAQLADLEALCMRRGLSAEAQQSGDAAAGPTAAGRAARVASKRRERDALSRSLELLRQRQRRLEDGIAQERAQAQALAGECAAVGRQVAEVFEAAAA